MNAKVSIETFIIILILILLPPLFQSGVDAENGLPSLPDSEIPDIESPGAAFSPPSNGTSANGTPQCAEWTRTAGPDESIVITGDDFAKFDERDKVAKFRFRVYGPNGFYPDAKILHAEKDRAVIVLDKALPAKGMYLIWPENKKGFGKPIAINKTEAWWLGPNKARRGNIVSVFGRNLSLDNTSNIFLKPKGSKGFFAKIQSVNPYKIDFALPADAGQKEYEVWVHNGYGGKYGWSGPLNLQVEQDINWSVNSFNVKKFGATGNGNTDDTEAIQKAIRASSNSRGSSVYFPEGSYLVSRMLQATSKTKWIGDGPGKTIIKPTASINSSKGAKAMAYINEVDDFQLEGLSFDIDNNYHPSAEMQQQPLWINRSSNITFRKVEIVAKNRETIRVAHSQRVRFDECKFVGKQSFLENSSQLFIDRCQFEVMNDAETAIKAIGLDGFSLTNSSCKDFNNSKADGWGMGRFFVAAGGAQGKGSDNGSSIIHTYFEGNNTIDLAPRPGGINDNAGEQLLWEGLTSIWSGDVSSSDVYKTTVKHLNIKAERIKYAVIIRGTGLGQSRRITDVEGNTLTLEKAWNVIPDRKSVLAIVNCAEKVVVYNNSFDGKAYAAQTKNFVNASTAVQIYGSAFNFIADKNSIQQMRYGICNLATQHTGLDPNYFALFSNNQIKDCHFGIRTGIENSSTSGIAILGSTFRKNIVHNAVSSAIATTVSSTAKSSKKKVVEEIVYEHNQISNAGLGLSLTHVAGLPNGLTVNANTVGRHYIYNNHFGLRSASAPFDQIKGWIVRANTSSGKSTRSGRAPLSSR